jgi:PAS domain-containing protein
VSLARPPLSDVAEERDLAVLANVLEQLPLGVVLTEWPTRQVLFANPAIERILGRKVVALGGDPDAPIHAYHLDGRRYDRDELPAARALRGETVTGEVGSADGGALDVALERVERFDALVTRQATSENANHTQRASQSHPGGAIPGRAPDACGTAAVRAPRAGRCGPSYEGDCL